MNNTETDQKLKIRVMNITKDQLADTLEDFEGQMWTNPPSSSGFYTDEYSMFGGETLRCGDRRLRVQPSPSRRGPVAQHVRHLRLGACALHRGGLAQAVSAWKAGRNCRTRRTCSRSSPSPDYASWQSLRESEDARYKSA